MGIEVLKHFPKDLTLGFKLRGQEGIIKTFGTAAAGLVMIGVSRAISGTKKTGTMVGKGAVKGGVFVVAKGIKPAARGAQRGAQFVTRPLGGLDFAGILAGRGGDPKGFTPGSGFEPTMEVANLEGTRFESRTGIPVFVQDSALRISRARAGRQKDCNCSQPAENLSQRCRDICGK